MPVAFPFRVRRPYGDDSYLIGQVDGSDEAIAVSIMRLHIRTFGSSAPVPSPSQGGFWWLACDNAASHVAFASIRGSSLDASWCYFDRVGVLPEHRGAGLQRRLMRACEAKARRLGFKTMVSDTTDNPPSAANFDRLRYQRFTPDFLWGFPSTLYWRKTL